MDSPWFHVDKRSRSRCCGECASPLLIYQSPAMRTFTLYRPSASEAALPDVRARSVPSRSSSPSRLVRRFIQYEQPSSQPPSSGYVLMRLSSTPIIFCTAAVLAFERRGQHRLWHAVQPIPADTRPSCSGCTSPSGVASHGRSSSATSHSGSPIHIKSAQAAARRFSARF